MANSKIITYDLCKSGKNYDELYDYIKSFPQWAHITESTWFVSSTKSCSTIRDEILEVVDSDDRVFVGELTGVSAWYNVLCKNDYLKSHL